MPNNSLTLRPRMEHHLAGGFRATYRRLVSLQDLAAFWCLRPSQLSYYAYRIDKRLAYREFSIPRRYGRERRIEAPSRT